MEAILYNKDLNAIAILDKYISFIWTDRYDVVGDFEITMRMSTDLPRLIQKGYYLQTRGSDHTMIVDTTRITTDVDEGARFVITGESLESILKRRIVWKQTNFNADDNGNKHNLQNGIKQLLEENVINPEIAARKIDNFIFDPSTDPKITSLEFEAQYLGEDLYKVISELCKENEIGFKITINDNKQFVFKLYAGVDRSYEQTNVPCVIFSPTFDNLSNTSYIDSDRSLRNVTLIVGGDGVYNEETGEDTRPRSVHELAGGHIGIERREIFTDATSLSTDDGYGGKLSAVQYAAHMQKKGIDTLMANTDVTLLDGKVDPVRMYIYGKDYFIGDIVQLENEFGQEGTAYISEYIMSCEESGTSAYPTFTIIEKGKYET